MGVLRGLAARFSSEKAQGMTEYALILGFVVAVAAYFLTSTGALGTSISNTFDSAKAQLESEQE